VVDLMTVGEAAVVEAWRQTRRIGCARCGPSDDRGEGWQGSSGGPDGDRRGEGGAGMVAVEE
jgi:hypothetical protein